MSASERNASISLKAYLQDVDAAVKALPSEWVRCELHSLKVGEKFTKMEFIDLDAQGKQVAKANGGCFPNVWKRIDAAFREAGLPLKEGSQVLVKLQAALNPAYGFNVSVMDIDVTFALGDLNARIQAIRKQLKDAGHWGRNRALVAPTDFTRVAVISPSGAAGLGDFRSSADQLASLGLVQFDYYEAPFQTREAPARIVDLLRSIYRDCMVPETRYCAVAIIRGGGASADPAWLIDYKLTEAVCRMNVPVMTGIGHERDRNLLDEVSCLPCDTPSKVAEHVTRSVTQSAMSGRRAYETIVGTAMQIVDRAHSGVREAVHGVGRDAGESVRLADTSVTSTMTAIGPAARDLLDVTRTAVTAVVDRTRSSAGELREEAGNAVRELSYGIRRDVETSLSSGDAGVRRALDETSIRLESLPSAAEDDVRRMLDQIGADVRQTLDECSTTIAMVRERADALSPSTVLAAGYAILRTEAGAPLTSAAKVRRAATVTAEMRDGRVPLTPNKTTTRKKTDGSTGS